jgi:phosphate-selective porin OprO/OprP
VATQVAAGLLFFSTRGFFDMTVRFVRRVGVLVLASIISGALSALSAQTPSAPQPPAIMAGWSDGFVVQDASGDYRLQLGMVAQADGRFAIRDDQEAVVDTFTIRKLRPMFQGRVARYFDFQVVPDFGNGTTVLQDAYLDVRFSPAFRVRMGKSKTPLGYEILISDPYLLFPERSLASSLVPNRDVGVHVLGDLVGGRLHYQGGVFNGMPDAASSVADVDANEGKDLAGRIVIKPFRSAASDSLLNDFGFAIAGSYGQQEGALPRYRTSVGQSFFNYHAAAAADGTRTRVTPAVFYYAKSFGGFAEYVRSTQEVARAGERREFTNSGWDVNGSYVLTGEGTSERGVRPASPFDPTAGRWGALQLVGRYAELAVDRAIFGEGFAAAGASRTAKQFTLGANWYPANPIKYYVTYERVVFDGEPDGSRHAEDTIVFRAQLAF